MTEIEDWRIANAGTIIDLSPKWPLKIHIKLSVKSIPAPERPPLVW